MSTKREAALVAAAQGARAVGHVLFWGCLLWFGYDLVRSPFSPTSAVGFLPLVGIAVPTAAGFAILAWSRTLRQGQTLDSIVVLCLCAPVAIISVLLATGNFVRYCQTDPHPQLSEFIATLVAQMILLGLSVYAIVWTTRAVLTAEPRSQQQAQQTH
ncbi:MAG: hypothetical protein ACHRHE_01640 [Tepidisphaerales bacterium]